jgi:hypothetical protein
MQKKSQPLGISITFHMTEEEARIKARKSGGKVEKLSQGGWKVTKKSKTH